MGIDQTQPSKKKERGFVQFKKNLTASIRSLEFNSHKLLTLEDSIHDRNSGIAVGGVSNNNHNKIKPR